MSLDIHLEADERLSITTVSTALKELGALDRNSDNHTAEGIFESGLSVSAACELDDHTLYAEDTKGMNFPVAIRCYIRIKGPEPEGYSAFGDLERFVKHIATKTDANFVVSFQYESALYWKNSDGLHTA
ncbi:MULTISPECIES: hypothetical protein [Pseudomonadaceae]|uniref:Uncharacterized protein n=1 Tax=Ectopseudomonas hydrolytica TaxID=2493633 RepID=A0ABY5A6P6_9GAMM|nr:MULTISPECIES: hypothetical protein [Pseudomonas]MBF8162230.1 hypothetical protein [Pseudomonas mendocina]MDH0097444.1 hypothetical protein [Pseudomonas sp. GD04158]USR39562.1 hypothetical protein L1F06_023370 [Pseudomonas hydrolytica]UTH33111.1 hypothetical protein NLY38_07310 [Pseudomonas hydrolytica]UZZ12339.1 hypothetical protein NDO41_07640 [Pseudomonas mendocina]